jgi:hypothetical protein
MLFKITSFIFFLIFLTYISAIFLQAQEISSEIYETEEDLREGLESGALTLDQYLELLDLIQGKVKPNSEEAGKLFFVPGVSTGDVSRIQTEEKKDVLLNQRTSPFLSDSERREPRLSGRLVWRFYEEFQGSEETDSYLRLEIANKDNFIWRMEGDKTTDRDFRIRKRSLTFFHPRYRSQVIVGNFDKKIGLGLNVGYHPRFAYSSSSDPKTKDSFLYPTLGRYNGIFAESKVDLFSFLAFYSNNKKEEIEDEIAAFDLNFLARGLKIGLCVSEGKLKNIQNKGAFKDDCRSLHFDWRLKSIKLSGEYALLSNRKSGRALDFYSRRKPYRVEFSWWSYDEGFVHPFGGGLSNPDYETTYLEEIDYDYRSRQAGERGIFFKSRYELFDRLNLNCSYTQWRETRDLPQKMKFKVGFGYDVSKDVSFVIYQLFTDYDLRIKGIDRKVSSVNLFLSLLRNLDLRFIANYRTREKKNYGDFQLKTRTQMLSLLDCTLWLKYNDSDFSESSDGYFSFHVQERLRFFGNYSVSAEYVTKLYQDKDKIDTRAVRVRMDALW